MTNTTTFAPREDDTTAWPEPLEVTEVPLIRLQAAAEEALHLVEWGKWPPGELLKVAEEEAPKMRSAAATDYVHVVEQLRKKGFTWNEVGAWFSEHGLPFSAQTLQAAHYKAYKS